MSSHTITWPSRIVLDSMYFRGAGPEVVERLRKVKERTGCEYRLSLLVLIEALRVGLEKKPDGTEKGLGPLMGPLNRLRPILPEQPLDPWDYYEPPSVRTLTTSGGRPSSYERECRLLWKYINSAKIQNQWPYSAQQAVRMIDERSSKWQAICKPLTDEQKAIFAKIPPNVRVLMLRDHLLRGAKIPPELWDRVDALYRATAWLLLDAALGNVGDRNDDSDRRLLWHLSDGRILMTGDTRLVRAVRESGSIQAPWVLTLEEIENGAQLPTQPPWHQLHRGYGNRLPRRLRRQLDRLGV